MAIIPRCTVRVQRFEKIVVASMALMRSKNDLEFILDQYEVGRKLVNSPNSLKFIRGIGNVEGKNSRARPVEILYSLCFGVRMHSIRIVNFRGLGIVKG